MNVTRRLRGLIGIATTWGVCFSGLSSLLYFVAWLSGSLWEVEVFGARIWITIAARGFVVGAFAGAVFSLVLAAAERRRTLSGLSSGRVALWGFLGTASASLDVHLRKPSKAPSSHT